MKRNLQIPPDVSVVLPKRTIVSEILGLLLLILSVSVSSGAQNPGTPTAKEVMEKAIAKMCVDTSAQKVDTYSFSGTMQMAGSNDPNPIRVLSRGTADIHITIGMQEGAHSVALLRGKGTVTN